MKKTKYDNYSKEQLIDKLSKLEKKKYGLVWDDKPEAVADRCEKELPILVEDKNKEIICDSKKLTNFIFEGDNYHALYALNFTHQKKIDVIYIDPPYNTGKEDFKYNDKFIDDEDRFRHSKWLSFMSKRLHLSKKLLKQDGLIFISIDNNEYANLKMLCDKVFGEKNLLSVQHIQVRYGNKSLNEKKDFQEMIEYVLVYAKDKSYFKANKPSEIYDIKKFNIEIKELSQGKKTTLGGKEIVIFQKDEYEITKTSNGGMDLLKETWASGSVLTGNTSGKFFKDYIQDRKLTDGIGALYKVADIGDDGIGYRYFTGPKRVNAIRGKFYSGVPLDRRKDIDENKISLKERPIINYYDFSADFGNIRHEGGVGFNSGKKPIKMLKQFINYHKNKNVIVLDFFAGSGSTAHAVLELNKDGGNRQFILCTNNEVGVKSEKEFCKKYDIPAKKLKVWKDENKPEWIKWCGKNGICSTVTYPRIKNIISGYANTVGISANVRYFKTDFIPAVLTDNDKRVLAESSTELLCIAENTFNMVRQKEILDYAVFSNSKQHTAIIYDENFISECCNKLNKIQPKNKTIIYVFSYDHSYYEDDFKTLNIDFVVKPIPEAIINVYRKISKLKSK